MLGKFRAKIPGMKGPISIVTILVLALSFFSAGFSAPNPTKKGTLAQGANWISGGPAGGYVISIAVAPSNPSTVYAGTVSGVYKSTNGGAAWSPAGLTGIGIQVVRVDPANADTIYAGANVNHGFYRSTDGGASWTQGTIGEVIALDIDPSNPAILWAGTDAGRIYRSTDSGNTWTQKLHHTHSSWNVPINSIVIDPESSSTIFAGLGDRFSAYNGYDGFAKSIDGGNTWNFKHVSYLEPWDYGISLVSTPVGASPHKLFIISDGSSSSGYMPTVYGSSDKGETWTEINVPHISQPYGVTVLYVNPADPDKLFVGTSNPDCWLLLYNHSAGSWVQADGGLNETIFCVAVNPQDANIAYAGSKWDGKLYKSEDGGVTWGISNPGLNNSHVNDLAVSPSSSETVYAALTGSSFGLQKSHNAGVSWSEIPTHTPGSFSAIAIDPNNVNRMFAGKDSYGRGSIYRSLDNGISWSSVDSESYSGRVTGLWIHPSNSNIVLALKRERTSGSWTYYGGVRRSTDGGSTWSQVFNWWRPNCLASDPGNHDTVYLGVESLGYVYRSTNAGLSWANISPGTLWLNVYDIVVDSDSNVYITATDYEGNAAGGIWKWNRTSWEHLKRFDNTTVTALAIDRTVNPAALYAGTSSAGVFLSSNGGMDWEEFNSGLGALNITRLELSHTLPRILYAGTNYGGVWSTPVLSGHSIDNPRNFQATAVSTSQISLSWSKNTANNNVMLAWSPDGTFGTPQDGAVYNAGASIPGGGTVLYRGSNTTFNHSGLNENTAYYYRAYSYTAANEYSTGSSASSTTPMGPIASFPWTENFEDNSPTRSGWTQIWESGANSWSYAAGSNGGSITSAYQGTKNARFTGSSGGPHVTKLITPVLNLSSLGNPELSFWYGQEEWEPDQNELRVYYRTSPSASWVELFHDSQNRSTWTKQTLALPNRSGTYQIAFEGVDRWGYANVLDNVTVSGEELVSRIYGSNRYTTAVEVSQAGWPAGAGTVLLARGDNFPDSLAGVSLAYQLNAPILLTPTTSLHDATKEEIERLGASRVILLGGTGAISAGVETELLALGTVATVNRLGGANRYETAKLIAGELDKGASFDTAFIAFGLGFPDALAAASYGATDGYPILLTGKNSLPAATKTALDNLPSINNIVIVGGEAVISSAVEAELIDRGLNVQRIMGANRYDTAVELAREYLPEVAKEVFIATGLNFPDALAGGVLAAKRGTGVLLVRGDRSTLPDSLESFLAERGITRATILGGTSAVNEGIEERLLELLE